ncbi:MAG: hypothetical protein BGO96_05005 [Micrococcales bacterium 73-15]|nr:MAG: hypothetical protein BGO96_05005 [Micrococcales bacterium 73-15]
MGPDADADRPEPGAGQVRRARLTAVLVAALLTATACTSGGGADGDPTGTAGAGELATQRAAIIGAAEAELPRIESAIGGTASSAVGTMRTSTAGWNPILARYELEVQIALPQERPAPTDDELDAILAGLGYQPSASPAPDAGQQHSDLYPALAQRISADGTHTLTLRYFAATDAVSTSGESIEVPHRLELGYLGAEEIRVTKDDLAAYDEEFRDRDREPGLVD